MTQHNISIGPPGCQCAECRADSKKATERESPEREHKCRQEDYYTHTQEWYDGNFDLDEFPGPGEC